MTKLHPDDIEVLRRMTGLPFSVMPEDLEVPLRADPKLASDREVKHLPRALIE